MGHYQIPEMHCNKKSNIVNLLDRTMVCILSNNNKFTCSFCNVNASYLKFSSCVCALTFPAKFPRNLLNAWLISYVIMQVGIIISLWKISFLNDGKMTKKCVFHNFSRFFPSKRRCILIRHRIHHIFMCDHILDLFYRKFHTLMAMNDWGNAV